MRNVFDCGGLPAAFLFPAQQIQPGSWASCTHKLLLYQRLATRDHVNFLRINTDKIPSEQATLTPFGRNALKKKGGGGQLSLTRNRPRACSSARNLSRPCREG